MKPNLPGHCREACVFAPTRLLAPTRRQHQAGRMKQICIHVYYSKFAKDQLFDNAYFSPIANDTPVRVPHYCVLK